MTARQRLSGGNACRIQLLSMLALLPSTSSSSTSSSSTSSSSTSSSVRRTLVRPATIAWLLAAICILMSATTMAVDAVSSLLGEQQSCSNEGEEVQLQGIQNAKCFKCACQNGFVNCDKESCPSIDDCYLLEPKASDTCCRKCKGCLFNGAAYASGSEWTDERDPCRTYKCVASVITETTMRCFTQCDDDQTMPPRPGECCPTCRGCTINGQIVTEGQEVVASIDDRCLVCQCNGNALACAKKTCPILQCPITKQKLQPNECCPRCTEHREFMAVAGKCIFNNKVYYNRTQFMPDRCVNCTCLNGTSACLRRTCPILECAPEYQVLDGCCSRCLSSEARSECIHGGITYPNNATWQMGPCRSCRCNNGNIRCSEMRCPTLRCRANEERKVAAGQCCAACVETAGTCTVFGDPHFRTFDGKFFSFQGSCKYLLAADCRDNTFLIRLTNDGRGTRRSSWTKTVTIKLGSVGGVGGGGAGVRINFGQKQRVKVNGTAITLPYHDSSMLLTIERLTETIRLRTSIGVSVEWDGNNFVQIAVPASYKQRLCGLCGNYNGIGRDDLIGRDGINHSETEAWRFANSWKVGGPKACSRRLENAAAQPSCKQRKANAHCRQLREVFGNCDSRLNPNNYIESCKMDFCECPTAVCHCDSFAAYAHECRRLGVDLPNWRQATNCPLASAIQWRRNNNNNMNNYSNNNTVISYNILDISSVRQMFSNSNNNHDYNNNSSNNNNHDHNNNSSSNNNNNNNNNNNAITINNQQQRQRQSRRRKLQQQQQQLQLQQLQQLQHNQLLQRDYIANHIPKSLLGPRSPDRTPPPLH